MTKLKKLFLPLLFLSFLVIPYKLANAGEVFQFEITSGEVKQTPGFCSINCPIQTASMTGTFTAEISDDGIVFSDILISTSPNLFFQLPNEPNTNSNGTSRSFEFSFDGEQLTASGVTDSRAFDGPLVEYSFTAEVSDIVKTEFDQYGYFTARRDFRKCVTCGGYFVKKVNRRRALCGDGAKRIECYVISIKMKTNGNLEVSNSQAPILIQGEIGAGDNSSFDNLSIFKAKSAYRPVTDTTTRGVFVGLEDAGIQCITTPCFSANEYILNRKKIRSISNIDLEKVGATEEQVEQANSIIAKGGVLLAKGFNRKIKEPFGTGVTFIAKQFYLPILPDLVVEACPAGYSFNDGFCTTPIGCVEPELELWLYGGVNPIDPFTGEEIENITKSCVDSCEFPLVFDGPGRCAGFLP